MAEQYLRRDGRCSSSLTLNMMSLVALHCVWSRRDFMAYSIETWKQLRVGGWGVRIRYNNHPHSSEERWGHVLCMSKLMNSRNQNKEITCAVRRKYSWMGVRSRKGSFGSEVLVQGKGLIGPGGGITAWRLARAPGGYQSRDRRRRLGWLLPPRPPGGASIEGKVSIEDGGQHC